MDKIKMTNEYILVKRSETTNKSGLIMPKENNCGTVVEVSPELSHLKDKVVFYGNTITSITVNNMEYLVMKRDNVYLYLDS